MTTSLSVFKPRSEEASQFFNCKYQTGLCDVALARREPEGSARKASQAKHLLSDGHSERFKWKFLNFKKPWSSSVLFESGFNATHRIDVAR